MGVKICRQCLSEKEESEFYKTGTNNTLVANCKSCYKQNRKREYDSASNKKYLDRSSLEGEYWACLIKFPGYEISSQGRIYSLKSYIYLRQNVNEKGYVMVKLYTKYGEKKTITVHRLVALAFIENPKNKPEIHHINYDKKCNTIDNLIWFTTKENINDAINQGVRSATVNLKKNAMFTDKQVIGIKKMFLNGIGNQEISKMYNCCHSTISKIRTGVNYPHIKI